MTRIVSMIAGVAVLALLAGAALAHGPGRWGAGFGPGAMGMGHMGPGMMGGAPGGTGCPGFAGGAAGEPQAQITEDKAKALAQEYADRYLQGYRVEKVLPFAGRHMTMYSVELRGPNDELRVLHVNPFGNVMPFGGPSRRGA